MPDDVPNPGGRYQSELLRYLNPILLALRELGGEARPKSVYNKIAELLNTPTEVRQDFLKSGASRFENKIAWARNYLYMTGYLDSPSPGVWRLTSKGANAQLTAPEIDAIYQQVQEAKREARRQQADDADEGVPENGDTEETLAPSPETSPYSSHRDNIYQAIKSMSWAGFERFCVELLRETGVENLDLTPPGPDGGIDGFGELKINEFYSLKIAFQCKHYANSDRSVSIADVNSFRGALPGDVERGILFTSSSFSKDAINSSKDPGRSLIELVDINRILEICDDKKLKLKEEKIYILDSDFWGRFKT